MHILIKRIYATPAAEDGVRILVDRLWPRGLTKEKARVDVWLKGVAPSNALRKWYHHNISNWAEFKKCYFAELDGEDEAVNELLGYLRKGHVTFLYSSKELEHNNAAALRDYMVHNYSSR